MAVVGTSVSASIAANPERVKLCTKHYAMMQHVLDKIEAPDKRCSVCGENSRNRKAEELTPFPYEKIRQNVDSLCVIEDSLTAFKGKHLRPQDLKLLYSPCRLVLRRRVSLCENAPRLDDYKMTCDDFEYGPTPRGVLKAINFVREQLLKPEKRMLVRLTEVQERYQKYIDDGNHEKERRLRINDSRTLKKYVQPPLASTDIHLFLGSRKTEYFFCTFRTFEEFPAAEQKGSNIEDE